MSRVTQVKRLFAQPKARLLAKKPNYRTDPRDCLDEMVKRVKEPTVTIGSAELNQPIKKGQAWRYKGGVVQPHPTVRIGSKDYYDHIDTDQARRKQESNFFITLNTNRDIRTIGADATEAGKLAMKETLLNLAEDKAICTYMKFGPKHPHYKDDRYEDVITSIEWNSAVEVGEDKQRLHCHIWLTVHHYSQVQINMPMMQKAFKEAYNKHCKNFGHYESTFQRKRPYIQVKLLPSSDWAEVIKGYIHKGMAVNS